MRSLNERFQRVSEMLEKETGDPQQQTILQQYQ